MGDKLVVPQIHVQCELIVGAFYIEGGHIAHNAFHRSVDVDAGKEQIRKRLKRVSWLLILIVLGYALDSSDLAALMGIGVREYDPKIQLDLGV